MKNELLEKHISNLKRTIALFDEGPTKKDIEYLNQITKILREKKEGKKPPKS